MNYELIVNGFVVQLTMSGAELERIDALIHRLVGLRRRLGRRAIVFLAGMPGAGKSTLALLIAARAQEIHCPCAIQALGLDGFHYPEEKLKTTFANGIPLSSVKGSPETFDRSLFTLALARAAHNAVSAWPVYDRRLHDVASETLAVTGDILIVEGNWLLLREESWAAARAYCDHTILLKTTIDAVRPRLIARKMRGGLTRSAAENWFARVDGPNCQRFLRESVNADEFL